jgi:hypothetical protein
MSEFDSNRGNQGRPKMLISLEPASLVDAAAKMAALRQDQTERLHFADFCRPRS